MRGEKIVGGKKGGRKVKGAAKVVRLLQRGKLGENVRPRLKSIGDDESPCIVYHFTRDRPIPIKWVMDTDSYLTLYCAGRLVALWW